MADCESRRELSRCKRTPRHRAENAPGTAIGFEIRGQRRHAETAGGLSSRKKRSTLTWSGMGTLRTTGHLSHSGFTRHTGEQGTKKTQHPMLRLYLCMMTRAILMDDVIPRVVARRSFSLISSIFIIIFNTIEAPPPFFFFYIIKNFHRNNLNSYKNV